MSDFELGGIQVLFYRGKNRVREAKTLAQGHTGGQCPRPSWGPGLPDQRCPGGSRFQRWRRSSGDDVEQIVGLGARVDETRSWAEWRLKARWIAGFLRAATLHALSGRAFSPMQSLDWAAGGRKSTTLSGSFRVPVLC